ncbi:UNVERIFIED_CONTAM: XdhC family protein [Halobacillus marinus]|uniref:XdhC family protein n=1 Tax=Halobacillus sp. KGW1 TaxID=1793726 RepID=UPI000781EEE7|nr:XdhC/CoxI family protein [Halobacillus sp. KGW1]
MDDIHGIFRDLKGIPSLGSVMASIVYVEGSAYKKEGARMIIDRDGCQYGMLSAGCLEQDLAARMEQGKIPKDPEVIIYDMRGFDMLSWGEGSGCNGVIHVLVEWVTPKVQKELAALRDALERGEQITMIRTLPEKGSPSFVMYKGSEGNRFGDHWLSHSAEQKLLHEATYRSNERSQRIQGTSVKEDIFIHTFQPKQRLVILGAGRDARPVLELAEKVGYYTILADWRPGLIVEDSCCPADERIAASPADIIKHIHWQPNDCVMIMTHSFQKDREFLQGLIGKQLKYLGILGSKQRTKRLLGNKEIPPSITTPLGLSIKAEGPEEIAVSIMAELIPLSKIVHGVSKEAVARETLE